MCQNSAGPLIVRPLRKLKKVVRGFAGLLLQLKIAKNRKTEKK
jgi:hypothetical protein